MSSRCRSLPDLPVFLTLLAFIPPLWGYQKAFSAEQILRAARAAMTAAGHCFLITLDEEGHPQARIMDPFEPEPDMTVWLATNPATRKAQQIRSDERATLAYYDAEGIGYVTLIGTARLVDDIQKRRKYWKEKWEPFYPGGPGGDKYILIQFIPSRIEVMSYSQGVAAEPLGWRPAILQRQEDGWRLNK